MTKSGWIITIVVILLFCMFGSCSTSEYEEAGNTFDTWMREDPSTWSDTQKDYFNDFMEWSDNH